MAQWMTAKPALPTKTAAAAAPDIIPTFKVEDLMEVMGPNNSDDRTLSFEITGDPPSQARHRISWKRLVGKWKNHTTPVIYDPSAPLKAQYSEKVCTITSHYITHL
jgi:hypothetical protein